MYDILGINIIKGVEVFLFDRIIKWEFKFKKFVGDKVVVGDIIGGV